MCFDKDPISMPLITLDIFSDQVLKALGDGHISGFLRSKILLDTSECFLRSEPQTGIRLMVMPAF